MPIFVFKTSCMHVLNLAQAKGVEVHLLCFSTLSTQAVWDLPEEGTAGDRQTQLRDPAAVHSPHCWGDFCFEWVKASTASAALMNRYEISLCTGHSHICLTPFLSSQTTV